MFNFLGPIGAIKTPEGELEYGNVGVTDCVYLRYTGHPDVIPCLIYMPDELQALREMVKTSLEVAKQSRPGQVVSIGAMRPKPMVLRVALVHPHTGAPFLLLRLLQGNWKTDIAVGSAEDFGRLLRAGTGSTQVPLQGPLKRRPDGGWRIAGKELELLQGLSPGAGFLGEYLHPDEAREGEVLEVWTFPQDGKEFVATFRTKERWRPPARVEHLEGQKGDNLLFSGQLHDCREVHRKAGLKMIDSGKVDATWASKLTLSALVCAVLSGQDELGHQIWLGRSDEPILQLGLKAIEAGQTSEDDARLYNQLSSYYHSLNPNPEEASRVVNGIMAKTFDSVESKNWQEKRLVLNNWYLYLCEVYEGTPTNSELSEWHKCKARYHGLVVPKAIGFPPPHPWVIDWEAKESVLSPADSTGERKRSMLTKLVLGVGLFVAVIWLAGLNSKPPANVVKKPETKQSKVAPTQVRPAPKVSPEPVSILAGEWTVCGFDRKERRRADRSDMGDYRLKGLGPTWARFESKDGVLLTGIQRPTAVITGYVGESLFVDGKKVDTSGMSLTMLQDEEKNQTGKQRVQVVEGVDGRLFFQDGSMGTPSPLPGQPAVFAALMALEDLDLDAFKRAVNSGNVNTLFSNHGRGPHSLLSVTAGYSPKVRKRISRGRVSYAPFVKALIDAGADVKKYGEPAFWSCYDVDTATILLDAGVPVNCLNEKGRTKLFHASKDMEALLLARGVDPNIRDDEGQTREEFRESFRRKRK